MESIATRKVHTRPTVRIVSCLLALLLVGSCRSTTDESKIQAPAEVRLLGWIGYDEPDLLQLIKAQTGISVVAESFVGGDQMFATLLRHPDSYDLVVVDPEYIERLAKAEVIRPLAKSDFQFDDYFPSLREFPLSSVDSKLYAVLIRFGFNGLLYNTKHLTAEDVRSYRILTSEKLRGKVLLFDWYLPNMGVFSRILGNSTAPYDIDEVEFAALKRFMAELRPNVRAIQSDFSQMIASLGSGDTWVQPTAGESLTWTLRQTNPDIDWTIPEEGGVLWSETLAIPTKARNSAGAIKVIQFLQTPEGQAALVRRKAYIGSVPNARAYNLLTDAEKSSLKISTTADAESMLARVSVRRLPVGQPESAWQDAWAAFKAGS
jgi:spermidine/putrescine transport system substrate-binding protein